MANFHIYADEAWTHSSPPMGRYWCLFGGIFGSEKDLNLLNQQYELIRRKYQFNKEIKWSSLNEKNQHIYEEFIEKFFDFLMKKNTVIYRQFVMDRSFVHKDSYDNSVDEYGIDTQFKMYYQFLKHSFPLQKLPNNPSIKISLDNHTAQKKKKDLEDFLRFQWQSIDVEMKYVQSSKKNHIQAVDLIIGASGFRGNKIHFKTQGSAKKKNLKKNFSKYIYDKMRANDNYWRGTKAFNLFETTHSYSQLDGKRLEPFSQKLRIWKFVPKEYYKDKGWENDHLSRKGEYQKPDIHYRCEKTGKYIRKIRE